MKKIIIKTISAVHKGQRLDHFLVDELDGITRSQIKKMILDKHVKVNDTEPSVHYFLKVDDTVQIDMSYFDTPEVKPTFELSVISEHEDFLIINKPAGVIVHGFDGLEEYTLVDALVSKYPEIKAIGDDPARPGIVHRIDKDVSGLMVVARTQKMFEYLKTQFEQRQVYKEYLALVHGAPERREGIIDFPIMRSQAKRHKMAALPKGSLDGKIARTRFQLVKKYDKHSLLKVVIETGRTHQIRVHMNAINHPVVGDTVYAQKKYEYNLDRIFLHSHKLGFMHADGTRYEFVSYLPLQLKYELYNISGDNVLFIMSGPSGVGKTTLLKQVYQNHGNLFAPTTTYTTRPKRNQAVEDKVLVHIDDDTFMKMVEDGEFLEWAQVTGNYYGTHRPSIEKGLVDKNLIANIDVQGMHLLMDRFPEAITVFIAPDSIKKLKERIKNRGGLSAEDIDRRIKVAQHEIAEIPLYDKVIYNKEGKISQTYTNLEEFLIKVISNKMA